MPAPRAFCGSTLPHIGHLMEPDGAEWCNGLEQYETPQAQRDQEIGRSVRALHDWWMEIASQEVERVAPKAVEYGSTDLVDIGKDLGRLIGWENITHEEAAELGIYFYEVGKMARWADAIRRRARVSDDTLHDIGVYVRMAQRVRAVGGWPFGPEGESNA